MKEKKNNLREAALNYAQHGIAVFPLCPQAKNPLTAHGFKDATTDLGQIRKWWADNPDANIGIPTGKINNLIVIDIDPKHGGNESFSALVEAHTPLPPMPTVLTGTGGSHLYCSYSPDMPSSTGTVAPGIDIQSDGKYVVGPPSIHPNGNTYKWVVSMDGFGPLPLPPQWARTVRKNSHKNVVSISDGIRMGERNNTLTSLAGSLHHRGLSSAVITTTLKAVNQQNCVEPLPDTEVEGIARSVSRYRRSENGDKFSGSQAQKLLELASQGAELFHSPEQECFISFTHNGHIETRTVRSTYFRHWLTDQYHKSFNRIPANDGLTNALNLLEAQSRMGPERPVFTRVAAVADKVYIDLADTDWQVIEISAAGWNIISNPPVRFRRTKDMGALPVPEKGGSISEIRRFLNCGDEQNFLLYVSWLLGAMRGKGPYPILALVGSQGTAKSTMARIAKALVDPAINVPLRSMPRDERDLAVATKNMHVLAFTNISFVSESMSDALCRVATGEGFGTRTLYANDEETLFGGFRPICLNGIQDFAERADLLDRTLLVYAPVIPESARRVESELWADFEAARPRILGALLDVLVVGLGNEKKVKLSRLPRMADFAKFMVAAEPALPWQRGAFLYAYSATRDSAADVAFESSVVAQTVYSWFDRIGRQDWRGTATELLWELEKEAGESKVKSKAWPKSPKTLSDRLRRDLPTLMAKGIEVEFAAREGHERRRMIVIRQRADVADGADAELSLLSVEREKENIETKGEEDINVEAPSAASAPSASKPEPVMHPRPCDCYEDICPCVSMAFVTKDELVEAEQGEWEPSDRAAGVLGMLRRSLEENGYLLHDD